MILYFSATGNNKYVAERLSHATNDNMVSLRDLVKANAKEIIVKNGENFGVVMPCYWGILPTIFTEWLKKADIKIEGENHYIYFVGTYGMRFGRMFTAAKKAFDTKGISFDSTFAVQTVDNWNPMFNMTDKEFVKAGEQALERDLKNVISLIEKRTKGRFEKETRGAFIQAMASKMYELSRKTKKFSVDKDKCVGCGLCEKQCPISVIKIVEGTPSWTQKKCTLCLGCVHRCPKNAIDYNHQTSSHGQYVNNNVTPD